MILILQSLWNRSLTDVLVEGAKEILEKEGFAWKLIQVPGALELPLGLKFALDASQNKKIQGAVACGVVIKGDTYHFELVSNDSSRGLSEIGLKYDLPIGHAVLATYTLEQAQIRTQGEKNKGREGALAVVEMIRLRNKLQMENR